MELHFFHFHCHWGWWLEGWDEKKSQWRKSLFNFTHQKFKLVENVRETFWVKCVIGVYSESHSINGKYHHIEFLKRWQIDLRSFMDTRMSTSSLLIAKLCQWNGSFWYIVILENEIPCIFRHYISSHTFLHWHFIICMILAQVEIERKTLGDLYRKGIYRNNK